MNTKIDINIKWHEIIFDFWERWHQIQDDEREKREEKKKKRSSKPNLFPFVHTRLTTRKRMMQPFQHVWWHLTAKRHRIPLTYYRMLRTFQPLLYFSLYLYLFKKTKSPLIRIDYSKNNHNQTMKIP